MTNEQALAKAHKLLELKLNKKEKDEIMLQYADQMDSFIKKFVRQTKFYNSGSPAQVFEKELIKFCYKKLPRLIMEAVLLDPKVIRAVQISLKENDKTMKN